MSTGPTAAAIEAHVLACERNEDGYTDPDLGAFVFTSVFLRRAGQCCGKTCRHCPWPVDEQARAGREPGAPSWPFDTSSAC